MGKQKCFSQFTRNQVEWNECPSKVTGSLVAYLTQARSQMEVGGGEEPKKCLPSLDFLRAPKLFQSPAFEFIVNLISVLLACLENQLSTLRFQLVSVSSSYLVRYLSFLGLKLRARYRVFPIYVCSWFSFTYTCMSWRDQTLFELSKTGNLVRGLSSLYSTHTPSSILHCLKPQPRRRIKLHFKYASYAYTLAGGNKTGRVNKREQIMENADICALQ